MATLETTPEPMLPSPGAPRAPAAEGGQSGGQSGAQPATGSLWAGPPPVSSRRMSRGRRVAYWFAAPLIRAYMHLVWRTCRPRATLVHPDARALLDSGEPLLPCFWHERMVHCLGYFLRAEARGHDYCALVSPSVDGELASRVARRWDLRVVRGSSTRTGGKAIRELHRMISRDHVSLLVTPDGPHGPARETKPGVIMLAQLTGHALLPISYAARWARRVASWDRFVVPFPFSPIVIAVGEPLRFPRDLPTPEIVPGAQRLGASLDALTREAEAALTSGKS